MTIGAFPYSSLLLIYQMSDRGAFSDFSVAIDAADIPEMISLVRKPGMFPSDIYKSRVRKKMKTIIVRMTIKTYFIVILNSFFQVFKITNPGVMRAMAFPTCEFFILKPEMHAFAVL